MRQSALLSAPWIYLVTQVLSLLLILFYGAYPLLAMAGLAERLLPDDAPKCLACAVRVHSPPEAAAPDTSLPEEDETT